MMYKSFKHKKTSLSSYTHLLKKDGIPLGFHLHSFQNISKSPLPAPLSLSLSGDSRSGSTIYAEQVGNFITAEYVDLEILWDRANDAINTIILVFSCSLVLRFKWVFSSWVSLLFPRNRILDAVHYFPFLNIL
ncbi:hypothetical protein HanRHA438_Chr05g0212471 [Helianthus annuus]|nr:hypothetical protein HanRHA438_Chr05g0212471 [Helianthus annuus]